MMQVLLRRVIVRRPGIVHSHRQVKQISRMNRRPGRVDADGIEKLFIPNSGYGILRNCESRAAQNYQRKPDNSERSQSEATVRTLWSRVECAQESRCDAGCDSPLTREKDSNQADYE